MDFHDLGTMPNPYFNKLFIMINLKENGKMPSKTKTKSNIWKRSSVALNNETKNNIY